MATPLSLDKNLHGTAIIVGPGVHFGLALVVELGKLVSSIVLVARTRETIDPIMAGLPENIDVRVVQADVTDEVRFANALDVELNSCEPVRYVFYNIKQSAKGPALDLSADMFNEMLQANLTGALTAVQYVAKNACRESWVNVVVSGGGFKDRPDQTRLGLSVSKGGLHTLVLAMAPMLRKRGIRLKTVVIDGVVRSDGPLMPAYVAEALVHLADNPTAMVAKIDNASQAGEQQLSLF